MYRAVALAAVAQVVRTVVPTLAAGSQPAVVEAPEVVASVAVAVVAEPGMEPAVAAEARQVSLAEIIPPYSREADDWQPTVPTRITRVTLAKVASEAVFLRTARMGMLGG